MNNFLKELKLTEEQIKDIIDNNHEIILEKIKIKQKLIEHNLNFLAEIGINNNKDIFAKYPELFIIEPSIFKNKFASYENEDLVKKLAKNIDAILTL